MSTKFVEDICGAAREELVSIMGANLDGEKTSSDDDGSEGTSSEDDGSEGTSSRDDRGDGVPQKRSRVTERTPLRARPSDYLRSRCPLCFGGKSSLADG